jgi:CCR4-NOT transcription complex subunit 1
MEAKAKEFNEVIQEQYYPWFAQYMVMKRYHSQLLILYRFV